MTNAFYRTTYCLTQNLRVNVLQNRTPVGSATFTVYHETHLNLKGAKWSEKVTVGPATLIGNASGIETTYRTLCGASCNVTESGGIARPFALGASTHTGTLNYTVAVSKGNERTNHSAYQLAFNKPGYTPGAVSYNSASWRCDDEDGTYGAGCVYPSRIMVDSDTGLSKMAALPGISDNIRTVQRASLHIGKPGSSIPLTRATEAQKINNRGQVCGPKVKPKPGDIWWTVDPKNPNTKPSCDEYPFADTTQGGTKYAEPNRAIKWVPLGENNSQGAILRNFFGQYHILPSDNFYINVGA
ncbi:NucA/NucB deoxyribonuclease domain-containing protein [Streptomyces sp. NPDC054933]